MKCACMKIINIASPLIGTNTDKFLSSLTERATVNLVRSLRINSMKVRFSGKKIKLLLSLAYIVYK